VSAAFEIVDLRRTRSMILRGMWQSWRGAWLAHGPALGDANRDLVLCAQRFKFFVREPRVQDRIAAATRNQGELREGA
jgi:hypothetical protein